MANVLKSDGTLQGFDINKVIKSMEYPLRESGIDDPLFILGKAMFIQDKVYLEGQVSTEEIQDLVIKALMDFGNVSAVKRFILWGA